MDEDFDLRSLIETLIRGKWIVIVTSFTAILVSGFISFFILPRVYEATALASVLENPAPGIPGTQAGLAEVLKSPTIDAKILVSSFQGYIRSREFYEQAVSELKLDPRDFSAEDLSAAIKVEIVKDTRMIKITVRGRDPAFASSVANFAARRLDQFARRQTEAELEGRLAALQEQLSSELSFVEANITELEKIQAGLPATNVLRTSIARDPFLQELATSLAQTSLAIISRLTLENEELNPAYVEVQRALAQQWANKALLDAQLDQVTKSRARVEALADVLGAKIRLVVEAPVPDQPVSPRKKLNIAVAGVLGVMLGTFLVFFVEFWRGSGQAGVARQGVAGP